MANSCVDEVVLPWFHVFWAEGYVFTCRDPWGM